MQHSHFIADTTAKVSRDSFLWILLGLGFVFGTLLVTGLATHVYVLCLIGFCVFVVGGSVAKWIHNARLAYSDRR